MTDAELAAVLARYPAELKPDDWQEHLPELRRIAARILHLEANPPTPPVLPEDAPEWEHRYWSKRRGAA